MEMNEWEKAMGWRKRQMVKAQVIWAERINKVFDPDYDYERDMRNRTLEEVAKEIEKMTVFGKDTIGSFAVYVRNMKR
jgi:hypothetical protein